MKKRSSGAKDREIADLHKEQASGLPPAKLAAKEIRSRRLREIRELRQATEEQALKAFMDAGLTGEALAEVMRVWSVYRHES